MPPSLTAAFAPVARRFLLSGMALASVMTMNCAVAQTGGKMPDYYKEPGLYPNRDYANQHFGEHIDPFAGTLHPH